MLEQRKKQVLAAYQKLKKTDRLSVNLLNPTTANLRNECISVFSERPHDKIKAILSGFGIQLLTAEDIRSVDPDKFRPLRKFILGEIENPNIQTLELLAWLINVDKGDGPPSTENENKSFLKRRYLLIGTIAFVILTGIYLLWTKPQCMYWDGVSYQRISCDDGAASDFRVIKLDKERLANFKRITKLDTINYKDIGRIWYMKIDGVHEFYTVPGMHPVDERKQLKPVTKYIIDKYILKKDSVAIVNVGKNK